MKKRVLTWIALGLSVAAAPAFAQQSGRLNAPTAPAAPNTPIPPAVPSGQWAMMRFQMQALAASRGVDGKIATQKFIDEYMKAVKEADADSNGVLTAEEMTPMGGLGGRMGGPNRNGDASESGGADQSRRSSGRRPSSTRGEAEAGSSDRPAPPTGGGFGMGGPAGPGMGAPNQETGLSKALKEAANEDGSYALAKLEEGVTSAIKAADADSNGLLDDAESRAFIGGMGMMGMGQMGPRLVLNMASSIYQREATAAATTDGKLDIAKFRAEMSSRLKAGDENNDGVLDSEEQQKLEEKARASFGSSMGPGMGPGMGRGGNPLDSMKNEDGKIDLSKLPEQFPEQMKAAFKEADADGDGFIDADEEKAMQEKMREQFQRGGNRGPGGMNGAPGQAPEQVPEQVPSSNGSNGVRRNRRGGNDGSTSFENINNEMIVRAQAPQANAGAGGERPARNAGGPGMGMGGMMGFRFGSSGAVRKALTKATKDEKIDLAAFDKELTTILADADNEDDGLLDAVEQDDAFGTVLTGAPMGGGPGAGSDFGGPRGERPDNGDREAGNRQRPENGNRGNREAGRSGENVRQQGRGGFAGGFPQFIPTPDDSFVGVQADADFRFGKSASGKGTSEKAPIEKGFAIGKYEVRNREYKEFVDATQRKELPKYWVDGTFAPGTKNCPVVGVTLKDAQDYCEWLGTKYEGWTFRLPTEAEFEHAALGDQKRYPWGNTAETSYKKGVLTTNFQYNGAVIADLIAADATTTVDGKEIKIVDLAKISATGIVAADAWRDAKTKKGFTYSDAFLAKVKEGGYVVPVNKFRMNRSQFGVVGAAGNAAEWTTSEIDGKNVVRGGSWYSTAEECAATYRGETKDPTKSDPTVGFRVVAEQK